MILKMRSILFLFAVFQVQVGVSAPCSFDEYYQQNPDVLAAGIDPLLHYRLSGHAEGRCQPITRARKFKSCSYSEYLSQRPDVARAGLHPISHFYSYGLAEGACLPSLQKSLPASLQNCSGSGYNSLRSDVRRSGISPFEHYLRFGFAEPDTCIPRNQEVWFVPTISSQDFYDIPSESQWRQMRQDVDVMKLYAGLSNAEDPVAYQPQEIQKLQIANEKAGIKMALEDFAPMGYFCQGRSPHELGKFSAEFQFNKIYKPYLDAGIEIDSIAFDGPELRTLPSGTPANNCNYTMAQAVTATASYLREIRRRLPLTKFYWIVNLPNWTYRSWPSITGANYGNTDFAEAMRLMGLATNGTPYAFHGLQVDNPYSYYIQYANRTALLSSLNVDTAAQNWKLSLIVNDDGNTHAHFPDVHEYLVDKTSRFSAKIPSFTQAMLDTNWRWLYDTKEYAFEIQSLGLSNLNSVVIQSWHRVPIFSFASSQPGVFSLFDAASGANRLFNGYTCRANEYEQRRPDVIAAGVDPSAHYRGYGFFERMCRR